MAEGPEDLSAAFSSRYRIERELGRGGMATVYLAQDLKHGRQVALKVLDPEIARTLGPDRFLQEIRTTASLTHPRILPLLDSGHAGSLLWYAMPYIEGETLRDRLSREKQLPLDESIALTLEMAEALDYAHRHGIVHRDIKPGNILLSESGSLVADFGIAHAVGAAGSAGLTQTGVVLGTPGYMSPEQLSGGTVDRRSDLYSLACLLYEMLAGQPPFTGPTAESLAHQHLSIKPRAVTELRPRVPRAVAGVLARALTKSPADRFGSVAEFGTVLAAARADAGQGAEADVPNNLPSQLKSFVGRQRDLAECSQLLLEKRLLTFTGVGGCGKTRLALKLAEIVLLDFPDGVWFVELAPVTDGTRLLQVVAAAMGVREVSGTPLSETLSRHVAGMRTLVFLDNCEHLLDEVGSMAEHLLKASQELRVLATSREGLGVDGEVAYTVRSMPTPAADALHNLQAVEASEAVQLFVDRARHVAREFALSEATAPTVAEICRHLDGIPLAIELAAARVEVLSVEQIRSMLKDRFRLLTGGNRALPRHQTLRATIQWSYDHLTSEEQRLFRLVSVFSAGWTLEGATVVAGEMATEFEMLDQLTSLVRKSLVQVQRETGGDARFGMLETVRQYAQERLNESGEGDTARTRHFEFYLFLAEDVEHELHGPKQADCLRRLDQDLENVLSAHAWSDSVEGGGERGLRLAWALQRYWQIRGLLEAGLHMCRQALDRVGADARSVDRMRVLSTAGQIAYFMGRFAEARGPLEECLSIAQELGEKGPASAALTVLGGVVYAQGEVAAAQTYLRSALAVARESGYKQRISASLTSLAEVHRGEGNFEAAAPLYEEAVALGREMGDKDIIALNLINLSMLLVARGELEGARALLVEGLATAEKIGARKTVQMAMDAELGLSVLLGEWHLAGWLYGVSEAQMERMGYQRESADERFIAPRIAQARQALGEEAYAATYAAGRALSYEDAITQAKEWLETQLDERAGA